MTETTGTLAAPHIRFHPSARPDPDRRSRESRRTRRRLAAPAPPSSSDRRSNQLDRASVRADSLVHYDIDRPLGRASRNSQRLRSAGHDETEKETIAPV